MRFAILGLLAVVAPAQVTEQSASITGVVRVALATERAVRFRVAVIGDNPCCGVESSGTTPGTYEVKHLKPGRYRLVVTGSFESAAQSEIERTVTLASGQRLTMNLALPTLGAIIGRVLDGDGHPARAVHVVALDKRYSHGTLRYWPAAVGYTDGNGIYRLAGLPPGRSLIVRVDGSTQGGESPVDTFFPDAISPDAAQEIVLSDGEERAGVEIRRVKQPSYCLDGFAESGVAMDSMAWSISRSGVETDQLATSGERLSASGEPQQRFQICGMHSGRYQVYVTVADSKRGMPTAKFSTGAAVVDGKDVHGLKLTGFRQVTISGEIVWEGEPPDRGSDVDLFVRAAGSLLSGGIPLTGLKVPITFSQPMTLPMEDYIFNRFEITHGKGAYLKEFTWNGQHPPSDTVRLEAESGGHLRILIGSDGASVSIKVTGEDGQPVSNAYVAMIPASATNEADVSTGMISGRADQNGGYSTDAVPPGIYRVVAASEAVDAAARDYVAWDLNANLISRLWAARARSELVSIGARRTVELNLRIQRLK